MEKVQMQERQERHTLVLEQDGVTLVAITPSNLKSVLLADGWHDLTDAKLLQFAIAPGASPPKPNKVYSALNFKDTTTKKQVIVPLSQVLAFEGWQEEAKMGGG